MSPSFRLSLHLLLTFLVYAGLSSLLSVQALRAATTLTNTASMPSVGSEASTFTQIGAGSSHTCGLTTAGGIKCWGENYFGQLGDSTLINHETPVDVTNLTSGVKAIYVRGNVSCALLNDATVRCWGINFDGQLGNGTTNHSNVPVVVTGLANVIAIGGGEDHLCAILQGGALRCWGSDRDGQIGDGSTTNRTVPVAVVGLGGPIIEVAGGRYHTCALLQSGSVQCWGDNENGQLGNSASPVDSKSPVNVQGLAGTVVQLAGDYTSACALLKSSKIQCWGESFGPAAIDVTGWESGMQSVALGGLSNRCAITQSGTVACAGIFNDQGQLGNRATTPTNNPTLVVGISSGATAIAMGDMHACALVNGQALCWGDNAQGQLGIGQAIYRTLPLDVKTITSGFVQIAAGSSHTCGVTNAGGVQCWGASDYGQLGNNTKAYSSTPVDVVGLTSGVKQVSSGSRHSCAVTNSGGVKCWGYNGDGQLGNGSQRFLSTIPVDVTGLSSGVTAVAVGGYFTCALTTAGGVKCWGDNSDGQLGIGSKVNSNVPVNVSGLQNGVAALAAGLRQICALMTSGQVKCWGDNYSGQLGDGTSQNERTTPVLVQGLTTARAITLGDNHTCALLPDGGMKCWGGNEEGQLGDGATNPRLTPGDVISMTNNVQAITAGGYHTCAMTNANAVKCWGWNGWGQLGNGTVQDRLTPTNTLSLAAGVAALSAGSSHTCVLLTTGAVRCWGNDGDGELGIGSQARRYTATPVVEAIPRELLLSYTTGKPGSVFMVSGFGYAPGSSVTLSANGTALGEPLPVNSTGAFVAQLDTTGANAGFYLIRATPQMTSASATADIATIMLDDSAALHIQEGGGLSTRTVPTGIAIAVQKVFMALVWR